MSREKGGASVGGEDERVVVRGGGAKVVRGAGERSRMDERTRQASRGREAGAGEYRGKVGDGSRR